MIASESPASVKWERAQQVEISVDLISAAKQELEFLVVVDRTVAFKNRQVLERAVDRYFNGWLPLANKYKPRSDRTVGKRIATVIWNDAYPGVPYDFKTAGEEVVAQQQTFGPLTNRFNCRN